MATFTVTTLIDENDTGATEADPGGAGLSLREALTLANANADADAIQFAAGLSGGTLFIAGGLNDFQITNSVTIDGDIDNNGVADITIDADSGAGLNDADSRVFTIDSATNNASVVLDGLVIRDGNATGNGGGINAAAGDTLTVVNSQVTSNSASLDGGGISALGPLRISGSTISNNSAGDDGGALLAGDLTVSNSVLSGNSAVQYGGGVYLSASGATFINTTVADNTAMVSGGGITGRPGFDFSVIQSTFAGNQAAVRGGGIDLIGLTATTSTLTAINSVFADNTANVGADIGEYGSLGGEINATSSFFGTTVTIDTDGGGNTNGGAANLGVLADNGGAVQTILPNAGSPLLDAGNDTATFTALNETALGIDINGDGDTLDTVDSIDTLATDARGAGFDRTVDLITGGATVDIGTVEREVTPTPTTLVVTTNLDTGDDATVSGDVAVEMADGGGLSLREAVLLANANADANNITFDGSVFDGGGVDGANSLIRLTQGELAITQTVTIDGSTGTDIVITGDAMNNDATVAGTNITDVAASTTAGVLGDNSRVFNFSSNNADGSQLNNLTITGGQARGGSPNGDDGGGIRSEADLTILDSTISGNSAVGINADGGGIHGYDARLAITRSTIDGNVAGGSGGGVSFYGYFPGEDLTIAASTISNNSATRGGGLFSDTSEIPGYGSAIITNSTFYGNTASMNGGALRNQDEVLPLFNSTIVGNSSAIGGGVASFGHSQTRTDVSSSIIAGNTATTVGNDVSSISATNTDNSFNSLGNNLIGDGQVAGAPDFFTNGANGDIVGTTAAPIDPMLGPLSDNGGPVQTLVILQGSVAIDQGNNSQNLTTDANGNARTFDLATVADGPGGATDIGAVELSISMSPTDGNDLLIGTPLADVLRGLGGNDMIFGRESGDILNGGAGDDLLDGEGGRDAADYSDATGGVIVDLSIAGQQDTLGAGLDKLISI